MSALCGVSFETCFRLTSDKDRHVPMCSVSSVFAFFVES